MSTTYEDSAIGPARKTKSITLHITKEFYDECVQRAGSTPVCEWARLEFEAHLARKPIEMRMIEEFWALRNILLNGFPVLPTIDAVIQEADRKKVERAKSIFEGKR